MSHRKGKPVILKNMGAKIEFRTPHRADNSAIAATSRLLKYGISHSHGITIFSIRNTNIKAFPKTLILQIFASQPIHLILTSQAPVSF
jgi:hypothetical protein